MFLRQLRLKEVEMLFTAKSGLLVIIYNTGLQFIYI